MAMLNFPSENIPSALFQHEMMYEYNRFFVWHIYTVDTILEGKDFIMKINDILSLVMFSVIEFSYPIFFLFY